MELDESSQMALMFFLQKIMGEDQDNPIQDTEIYQKELEMLKNENSKLSKHIVKLEQELTSTIDDKVRLQTNIQQLKGENERLYRDIDRKSAQEERHSTAMTEELRNKINERDETINDYQRSFEKMKKKYEDEIAQIRDDLDIANAKVYQNINSDKTLQQYKKRLESLAGIKQKASDLQKQNENLIETVNSQHAEIELLGKSKKQIIILNEQLAKEKNRADTLSFNLDSKEKNLKKIEKEIVEYRQKIQILENKIEELILDRQDSSHASEESFVMQHGRVDSNADFHLGNQDLGNELKKALIPNSGDIHTSSQYQADPRKTIGPSNHEQIDIAMKEITYQKSLLQTKKLKLKGYKESILMCFEELRTRSYEYEGKISQLESNNLILSDQIQIMSDNLAEKENDKVIHEQTMYELEEVKAAKVNLLNDIKNLYAEKDAIHKKYIDGREDFFILQSQVNAKDMEIRELGLEIKLFKDKIQAYHQKEEIFNQEITSIKRNSVDSINAPQSMLLEREIIALKNENAELQLRLKEKTDRINEILLSKEEAIEKLQKENQENEEKYKQELEIKTKELVAQSEEAMNELFKQREQLVAKLQFERRNTMIG